MKTVLCDFTDSGVRTKILISLFFAFSVLSTVRLGEIAVLSEICENNLFLKFSGKTMFTKSDNLGLELK